MEALIEKLNDFNQLREYFFWVEYYDKMYANNELDEEFSELDERQHYLEKIDNIYKKYGVNSLNLMESIIEKDINNTQLYTSYDLCRNIIFIMNSSFYNVPAFKELYKKIIVGEMYNPNWNIGVSGEPFFMFLPVAPEFYETNLMIYKNPKLDWKILDNGMDSFMKIIFRYLNSNNNQEKEYYFKIINIALKSSTIDLNSHDRYKSETKKVRYYDYPSIKDQIEKISDSNIKQLIKNNKLKIETCSP